ncbi:rnhA operon protein [Halobacteriales archaeon QH_2_65_14]|nr:MAG: rnhA operon protein [Halobacteriales archaeon QH_2_65_14]
MPERVADEAYRLTRRVREDDNDVLVLYPDEWVEDGVAQLERIENLDRGVERPLGGPGETDRWEQTEAHNRELAETVAVEHGEVHGANAHALADFMSNHYAKRIETATGDELAEFVEEYFPRNAWPSDDQKAVVEESIRLVFECAGQPVPPRYAE